MSLSQKQMQHNSHILQTITDVHRST